MRAAKTVLACLAVLSLANVAGARGIHYGAVADPAVLESLIGRPAASFSAENLSYLRGPGY